MGNDFLSQLKKDFPDIVIGEEAIKLAGLQDDLAKILEEQTKLFGSMTTLRVGNPNNILPYDRPSAPKPITIHSKTSPLIGGFIPINPLLNKLDGAGVPIAHHHKDNLSIQPQTQLSCTLYELLSRCSDSGNLEMITTDPNAKEIQFKIKQSHAPTNYDIIFTVNLEDQKKQIKPRTFTRTSNNKVTEPFIQNFKSKFNIDDNVLLQTEFPMQFYTVQKTPHTSSQDPHEVPILTITETETIETEETPGPTLTHTKEPLMVFADEQGLPIAGDWDKDLESMALPDIDQPDIYNQEFNTLNGVQEQRDLLDQTKKLFLHLKTTFNPTKTSQLDSNLKNFFSADDFEPLITAPLLERAGAITPYELLQNTISNYCWNQTTPGKDNYLPNPFQHGAENRSPFTNDPNIRPDPGGPRLHIGHIKDKEGQEDQKCIIYTFTEDQRVKLYSNEKILETNFIHIHPSADMKKWGEVIEKQIECGQGNLISPHTINSYLLYKYKATPEELINLPISSEYWKNIIQRQIIFAKGPHILDQNPENPKTYPIPEAILQDTQISPPLKESFATRIRNISHHAQEEVVKRHNQLKPLDSTGQADTSRQLKPLKPPAPIPKTTSDPASPSTARGLNTNNSPIIFSLNRANTLKPLQNPPKKPR